MRGRVVYIRDYKGKFHQRKQLWLRRRSLVGNPTKYSRGHRRPKLLKSWKTVWDEYCQGGVITSPRLSNQIRRWLNLSPYFRPMKEISI